jgi:hypothetical protein
MASGAGRSTVLSRFRRGDDGSIAVLAAVTFPVVLVCVALAFAAIVWSASEHESQRAADQAAVRAAATAFLATDFPYEEIPSPSVAYPDVATIAGKAGLAAPAALPACGTVGLPKGVLPNASAVLGAVTSALTLPASCAGVGPFAPPAVLSEADQSLSVACATATDAMSPETATYANDFYKGDGEPQPSCANGRVGVRLATGSAFVGFGSVPTDSVTGALDATIPSQFATVQAVLAAYGIRLDSALPNLVCPEVSVRIDQPVREPLFDRFSEPSGRATARRLVKNAVVVPVYDGRAITAATDGAVAASAGGLGVQTTLSNGTTVVIPPQNLNTLLLSQQKQLIALLDEVDAIADAAVRAANVSVDALNGTFAGIDPSAPQPVPTAGAAPLSSLRLTKCLRDTLSQIYDPPSGDAPTADEILGAAAESGEQVLLVQVGTVAADCTEAGAIRVTQVVSGAPPCVRAATTPQVNRITGAYEVPFFDVTPALVQDLGDANYAAVPLHATQAAGAFRGGLVRAGGDTRYDPVVTPPTPTPLCSVTLPAGPTPSTACRILSITPTPVTTPTVPLPTSPLPTLPLPTTLVPTVPTTPLPTSPLPTLPVPTTTLPTIKPTIKPTLPGGFL